MGQKVHPKGLRLGIIENWDSRWFARREYAELLHEDIKVRNFLKKRLYHAGVSKIEIERAANKAKMNIHTARPGIVIGKKGAEIEKLKQELAKLTRKEIFINIHEVRRPDLDAQLVGENVALQLERRVAFRRAMKEAVARAIVAVGDESVAMGGLRSTMRRAGNGVNGDKLSLKEAARAASREAEKELILNVLNRTRWNRRNWYRRSARVS